MANIVLNQIEHNHDTCHKSGPVIVYGGDIPIIDYDASKMIVKNEYKLKKVINVSLQYADGSIKSKDMIIGNIETILYLKDAKLIEVTGKIVDIKTQLVRNCNYEDKAYIIIDASREYERDVHTIEVSLIRDFYIEPEEEPTPEDPDTDVEIPDVVNPINPDGTEVEDNTDEANSTEDSSNTNDPTTEENQDISNTDDPTIEETSDITDTNDIASN